MNKNRIKKQAKLEHLAAWFFGNFVQNVQRLMIEMKIMNILKASSLFVFEFANFSPLRLSHSILSQSHFLLRQ